MGSATSDQSTQGIEAYRRILGAPRVKPLLVTALFARMPIGIGAVALILFIHGETGSFGSAGVVTGAFSIGLGATGPIMARLIDRRGSGLVIPAALVSAAGFVAVVVLGKEGAGTVPLIAAAFFAGAGIPPVGGILRRHWPELVEPTELETAFAVDAIVVEFIFVSGPVIAGGLAATVGPAAGLIVAAVLGTAGAVAFQALLAVEPREDPEAERHWLGAMRSPTLRVLVFAGLPLGAGFGALDVMLPAFGAAHGASALGGPLTAVLSSGSLIGGVIYGLRPSILGPPRRAIVILGALLLVTYLPMVFAASVGEMFVFAAIAGLPIAPLITCRNNLAQANAAAGTVVEAFTWLSLAATFGASAGAAVTGPLVEAAGWRAGAIASTALSGVATLALLARRGLIGDRAAGPAPPDPAGPA
jgi:MFS family permease